MESTNNEHKNDEICGPDINANQSDSTNELSGLFPIFANIRENSISTEKSASNFGNEPVACQALVSYNLSKQSNHRLLTNKEMSSPNRKIIRKRRAVSISHQSKLICKRAEKPIDEIYKSHQQPTSKLDGLVTSTIKSGSTVADRLMIQRLEKENRELSDHQKIEKENLIKSLIENSQREREVNKLKVHNNRLQLGEYVTVRHGVHYEQKFVPGSKFVEIEWKRKLIEKQKEDNEKKRKALNKCKPVGDRGKLGKPRANPELDPYEFFIQSEKIEINKVRLNKEDKELDNELELLTRAKNSHLREMKRVENEEASRFNDFPTLNERYVVLSLLGKGGFSEVYKAFDLQQQRFVACKFHELNQNWTNEKKDSYIRHGLREIQIQKSLNHPRIVGVHDVFNVDSDTFVMVLEYCDGNDLDFYLKQNKCLPERDCKLLIAQLVSAVKYLTDRRTPIIHFDLKPSNILIVDGDIKVTDFGLSKIFPDSDTTADGIELTSQGAGTYWYLPPECFVTDGGPQIIDSKVDVWSIGVNFYQCLYGRKPFGHDQTQTDILNNNTIRLAKSVAFLPNPKVSDAAKEFITQCLTYNRQDRPTIFQLHAHDYLRPKV